MPTSKDSVSDRSRDGELVRLFQEGDQSAFDALVDKYSGKAFQVAYGVLGSRQDAEEVAQDAFIRIHRALSSFRGDAEFTTWMYRITVNLARNKYRWNKSRGAQKNVSMDAPVDTGNGDFEGMTLEVADPEMPPDERVAMDEMEKNLSAELERLPALYRETLVMRNLENLNYEQIADLLGCKLGTIKSRIARAREELRRRLKL